MILPFVVELEDSASTSIWSLSEELIEVVKKADPEVGVLSFHGQMDALVQAFVDQDGEHPDQTILDQLFYFFGQDGTVAADGNSMAIFIQAPFTRSTDYLEFRDRVVSAAAELGLRGEFVGRVPYFSRLVTTFLTRFLVVCC